MRTRTKGIQVEKDGSKVINKQYHGKRIFARLGNVSQVEAEAWLRAEQSRIDVECSKTAGHVFREAAGRYIVECERRKVRTVEKIAHYISLVMPYIGDLPLESVHSGSLQAFCDHRLKVDKVASSTVNLSLSCVRTILIRAARVWRNDDGTLWLNSAPLIEMLDGDRRKPRPISWEEQARLFKELPPHLQRMALFAVNTGVRDNNVCHLKWEWERRIPELNCSVFVIPAASFKSNRDHVVILNDVAAGVIESCRGDHSEYVFVCSDRRKGKSTGPIRRVTNTGWSDARKRAGLTKVRFHDLRHTFGQRLRDAGVSEEDRAVLMGHSTGSMPSHYATPTIARLIEMANLVQNTRDTPTLLRIVNG